MKTKDTILLEEAYEAIYRQTTLGENNALPMDEDMINNLIGGFNMKSSNDKKFTLERLQGLVGKMVVLTRAVGLKQSSGYGRDDGSATVPGSGGSVAHTELESIPGEVARGTVDAVKMSEGQEDYVLNGNLILTVDGKDYNMNQGTQLKVHVEGAPKAQRNLHNETPMGGKNFSHLRK